MISFPCTGNSIQLITIQLAFVNYQLDTSKKYHLDCMVYWKGPKFLNSRALGSYPESAIFQLGDLGHDIETWIPHV